MGKMKDKLMEEVANNMSVISNHMDGDAANFIARETDILMDELYGIMQRFAVIEATLDVAEEESCKDIYEEICNDSTYGEDFEEWWDTFEKIADLLD